MSDQQKNPNREQLDTETSHRLSRLATRPMDTSRLEARLASELAEAEGSNDISRRSPFLLAWWRPIATAAAVLLLVAASWLFLDGGGTPAMAAPSQLAQIHFDVANGLAPHIEVSTIDEANRLLSEQADGIAALPELPGTVMSCCLHEHGGAILACVLIEKDGDPITVAIADGSKLHTPHGKVIEYDGRQFVAHTANGINMVMSHEGGRWMCVMGSISFEQLAVFAGEIHLRQ